MGLMNCSRKDCEQILCKTYISDVGYVCNSCQSEFKEYLSNEGLNPKNEGEIKTELEKFMSIPKARFEEGQKMSVDDFFDKYK